MPSRPTGGSKRDRRNRSFGRETELRRRPAGSRAARRTVLIVTNGERTEVDYFTALRAEPWVTANKVTVKLKKGDPLAVVLRAASIRDDDEYDEAWAVCDADEFKIGTAVDTAHDHAVELVLSAPCFEVWLILHYKDGCPAFDNATQVGTHLKKIVPDWDKATLNFGVFRDGVDRAVTNAKRLDDPPANPSTAVWRLVESLRSPAD